MKRAQLQISSEIIGLRIKEFNTKVSKRQTRNYAAALKDANPLYFDDCNPEKLVAHPLFPVVLSWPIFESLHEYIDFPYPPEILRTVVHYTESIKYNRLLIPGEEVRISGEVAAVLPQKSGTSIVFEVHFKDLNGEWILTEYVGGFLRGVMCADEGKGRKWMPPSVRKRDEEAVLWERKISISKEDPYLYDGCTNIIFDIHTSPKFAKSVGLPGVIVQGTAVFGYVIREIINLEANGNPNLIKEVSCKFTDMILPDTSISLFLHTRLTTETEVELTFSVKSEKGSAAISDGYIKLLKEGE